MHTAYGDTVTIFIPDDQVADHEVRSHDSVRVIAFNSNRSKLASSLGHIPRLSYEFASIVKLMVEKEGKPDFIEAQEYLAISYYVLQFKLLQYPAFVDIPVIVVLHSPAFLYLYYNREGIFEFPNYWTGELEISCIQAADHVVAPSAYIVQEIKKHIPLNDSRISIVRNPYLLKELKGTVPGLKRNRIIFYGKLSPQKGVFELFEYFSKLWDSGRQYVLHVVGGTEKVYYPEMKTMGQLIEQRYAAYIRKGLAEFKGKVSPAERDQVLREAHVILIPSLNDNLPYAAIEAMSLGKVVLASRQGGQAELITDGINGFLFDHERPDSFREKLEEVLQLTDQQLADIGIAAAVSIRKALDYETVYAIKSKLLRVIATNYTQRSIFPFARPLAVPEVIVETRRGGLLSVVIPYFNMGAYINDCVASVLQSDYQHLEIVIVNDGSTEPESIQALEKLKGQAKIRIEDKANEGLAFTRNYGAEKANGQFLAFLDADDKVKPDYYSKAINVLETYKNLSFAGCWVQYFGTKNDIWPTWNPEPPYILLHNTVNSSALVYKKKSFLAAGQNIKKVDYGLEDYGSVISMLSSGHRGVVLPETLFQYRVRTDSMYRSLTRYKAMYSYQYLARSNEHLYRMYATDIFSLLNANGPSFAYDNPSFGIRVTSTVVGKSGILNDLKMFVKKNPALKKVLLRLKSWMKL
jgi:glycosyltransferase involved in cell wall biosynthesis